MIEFPFGLSVHHRYSSSVLFVLDVIVGIPQVTEITTISGERLASQFTFVSYTSE